MTEEEIEQAFKDYEDSFLDFQWDESLPSKRRDLCAFILLDKLVSGVGDIVSGASHDEIWLGVSTDDLAKSGVKKEDIEFLVRCGVRLGECGLCMFA